MNQSFSEQVSEMRTHITVLAILVAVLFVVWYVSPRNTSEISQFSETLLGEAPRERIPPPDFTEETQKKLTESSNFHALISYTDRGFEPRSIVIQSGEALRFTNNSSGDMWIAADATRGPRYPGGHTECGSSDLDSCEPVAPRDFWQFTFTLPGTWEVVNNLDTSRGVIVVVE